MLSIQGIYTGKEIKPLEDIHVRPNVRVIITFLEDDLSADTQQEHVPEDLTQVFLGKCGGWEDTRSPDEIIAEIYASRTTSERGAYLFPEDAE